MTQGTGPVVDLGPILPAGLAYTSLELETILDVRRMMGYCCAIDGAYELELVVDGLSPGDLDVDGDVDAADRTILTVNWSGATRRGDSHLRFPDGDFDGDGDVDSADATTLVSSWTGALQAKPVASIPEPLPLTLGLISVFYFLWLRNARPTKGPGQRSLRYHSGSNSTARTEDPAHHEFHGATHPPA